MKVQTRSAEPATERLATTSQGRCTPMRSDTLVCASAVVAALGLWSWWSQALGVDLEVRRGATTQHVGAVAVGVTVVVAAALGLGLLRLLERRSRRALPRWTAVAGSVFVASLLGPLGATTLLAGIALVSMHVTVAAVLVLGLRRVRRHEAAAA